VSLCWVLGAGGQTSPNHLRGDLSPLCLIKTFRMRKVNDLERVCLPVFG
jgi:hypothetical protein